MAESLGVRVVEPDGVLITVAQPKMKHSFELSSEVSRHEGKDLGTY